MYYLFTFWITVIGTVKGSDTEKQTINKRSKGSYRVNVIGTFAAGDHGKLYQDWNATCTDSKDSESYFYLSVSGSLTFSYSLRLSESKPLDELQTIKVFCNGTGHMQNE